jgi:putative FmdB family regulatory protein
MPVYEYQCTACSHEFEREQRISEDPVKKCPKCGKLKVKRLISRTSFVLKGSGWYSDLYGSAKPGSEKKDDAGKEAAPAASADTSPAKSDDKSGDAKPAEAKSEKKAEKKKSGKGKAAA